MEMRPWDIFEDIKEFVYVTDIDTDELVYMNASLRKSFALAENEEYRGRKCYEVLQARDKRCPFCTNHLLQEGSFHEWSYENPVLKRAMRLKDTVITVDGKRLRIEIAIDLNAEAGEHYLFSGSDSLVNQCLQCISSIDDPEEAVDRILEFIGQEFHCDRAYIFEKTPRNSVKNTHEWCAENVTPEKDLLQDVPIEVVDWWFELFEEDQLLLIDDLEAIRDTRPSAYAYLKPQNIRALAAGPLMIDGKVEGFFGVDNPEFDRLPFLTSFLSAIGYYISSALKRRDLVQHMAYLSYYDQLTGMLNRNAFAEAIVKAAGFKRLGVAACSVSGMKAINSQMGQDYGDQVLRRVCQLLKQAFPEDKVYRTGGDEFVVLCEDDTEKSLNDKVGMFRVLLEGFGDCHMPVGTAWSDQQPIEPEKLVAQADEALYREKQKYYTGINPVTGRSRDRRRGDRSGKGTPDSAISFEQESSFSEYIRGNMFDLSAFLDAMSQPNVPAFICFGDIQKNVFYISDNLRETFGFESNIVSDFLMQWGEMIMDPHDRDLYYRDMEQMMKEKRTNRALSYRVRDRQGKTVWIHDNGVMKWSEDGSKPLFFSGIAFRQDFEFVVDPISHFPMEQTAIAKLEQIRALNQSVPVVGFSLNNFAEINRTLGRAKADRLLQDFTSQLSNQLRDFVIFYRLDGIRFMAIIGEKYADKTETVIRAIRENARIVYRRYGVAVRNACSACLTQYPDAQRTDLEFIDDIIALISVAKSMPDKEYVVHSHSSLEEQRHQAQLEMELNRQVLDDFNGFRIVVQPIVNAKTGKIEGGETLLRWNNHGEEISPTVFVPMLEENKLILLVGKWIFEKAVSTCRRILSYIPDFHLSFNVSYIQIMDETFLPFVKQTLKKYGMDGSHMIMELTESHCDDAPEKLNEFLNTCREIGMQVALDDFGSGYSSLALLLKYPADIVKLDRSLVNEAARTEQSKKVLETIVYACRQFSKRICAEGVESEAERRVALDSGCDMIQGYYYHSPRELPELFRLLSEDIT